MGDPVEDFDERLVPFLERMAETMVIEGGVGLAAPQVGVSRLIAVINPDPDNPDTLVEMINPRIVAVSDEEVSIEEGCLSVPGIRANIVRPAAVTVTYQNREGRDCTLDADGLLARIIQHELDHLDGVLFVDRVSAAKRVLLKPRLRQLLRGRDGE
ncbi:MAG: peptide deformylase [Candidatus Krumholzibacteriota bacterium]|nr:peptide deformylase [Candidatus Krumholzibacteriota bacterium]